MFLVHSLEEVPNGSVPYPRVTLGPFYRVPDISDQLVRLKEWGVPQPCKKVCQIVIIMIIIGPAGIIVWGGRHVGSLKKLCSGPCNAQNRRFAKGKWRVVHAIPPWVFDTKCRKFPCFDPVLNQSFEFHERRNEIGSFLVVLFWSIIIIQTIARSWRIQTRTIWF